MLAGGGRGRGRVKVFGIFSLFPPLSLCVDGAKERGNSLLGRGGGGQGQGKFFSSFLFAGPFQAVLLMLKVRGFFPVPVLNGLYLH